MMEHDPYDVIDEQLERCNMMLKLLRSPGNKTARRKLKTSVATRPVELNWMPFEYFWPKYFWCGGEK